MCTLGQLAIGQKTVFVDFSCEKKPIEKILKIWEQDYKIAFAYNSQITQNQIVSVEIKNQPLQKALQQLFQNTSINFKIYNQQYIVLNKKKSSDGFLRICGYVKDKLSGNPLPYANISYEATSYGTTSSESGFFELNVPKGEVVKNGFISFSFIGYENQKIGLTKFYGNDCFTIELGLASQMIPEITIKEFNKEDLQIYSNEPALAFKPEKMPPLPGWGEPDVLRSLQLIPGISTVDESASNLNIRGGTSDQNLLLWDGIPIYHSGHFFGLYTGFNPYLVEDVTIFRGGFGAKYGGRVSGVIDIDAKPSLLKEPSFGVGGNLINFHAFTEIPLKKETSTLLFAVRRSYTDILKSKTYLSLLNGAFTEGKLSSSEREFRGIDGVEGLAPDFYFFDLNVKWIYKPGKKDFLAISAYNGEDKFEYDFKGYTEFASFDALDLKNRGISFHYEREWDNSWKTSIESSVSSFIHDYEYSFTFDPSNIPFDLKATNHNRLDDWTVRLNESWIPLTNHHFNLGWQFSKQSVEYAFNERDALEIKEFGKEVIVGITNGGYLDYSWNPSDRIFLKLGIRRDFYKSSFKNSDELRSEGFWQPRFNFSWRPFDWPLTWKLNWGNYRQFLYQVPEFFSNELGTGEQLWVLADDFFPSLNANQWITGFLYKKNHLMVDLEAYHKKIDNLTSWKIDLERDYEAPFDHNGTSIAYGIDLLIRQKWKRYSNWVVIP